MAKDSDQKAPAKDVKTETKSKPKKKSEASDDFLSKFRPKQRFGFFVVFLATCIGIVALYDPCNVKKKKDCGHSGISSAECRTGACFMKGGGEMDKRKITLKRKKGTKFGIVAVSKSKDSWVFVKSIKEGAVAEHNAQLPADSEDRILPLDSISSIDGNTGSSLRKKLSSTDTEKVVIEVRRTKLPAPLRWLHSSSKPGYVETLLTAPGFVSWFDTSSKLGGIGFSLWFLSGYPAASLPIYYFGLSGSIGWYTARCCHDENVGGGVPHCYRPAGDSLPVAWGKIRARFDKTSAKIRKDPNGYMKSWFWHPGLKAAVGL